MKLDVFLVGKLSMNLNMMMNIIYYKLNSCTQEIQDPWTHLLELLKMTNYFFMTKIINFFSVIELTFNKFCILALQLMYVAKD